MIKSLDCGGRSLDLDRVAIMGILNTTPDSFFDGGFFLDTEKAVSHGLDMVAQGADIIDVGGESTRPGAEPISVQQEIDRVIPVIERLHAEVDVPISIDSSKPEVMKAAVNAGAGFINDVIALRAEGAVEMAAALDVPVCLMHMQGEPRTMQHNPVYQDVVAEVAGFLDDRRQLCIGAGIREQNIVIDPGFGFGKTTEHNLQLLRQLDKLSTGEAPVLVGLSRKSMIGSLLNLPVDRRLHASVTLALLAAQKGANIVRVHDVAETSDALRMAQVVTQPEFMKAV